MGSLLKAARGLAKAMHLVSGVILVVMMATIILDIIVRWLFGATEGAVDLTFRGAVEIVSYGLLFMVLFSLPYSVNRGQVIVDLFTERMTEKAKKALAGFYTLGFGLLGLGMSLRFFESMERTAQSGETTQDLLIPLSYIYALATFATTVLAIRGLLIAYQEVAESAKDS